MKIIALRKNITNTLNETLVTYIPQGKGTIKLKFLIETFKIKIPYDYSYLTDSASLDNTVSTSVKEDTDIQKDTEETKKKRTNAMIIMTILMIFMIIFLVQIINYF